MSARRAPAVVLVSLLALAACGDGSTEPEGEAQDFTGTYTVVSFATGSSGTPIDGAAGTVTLTATTYTFSVTVPPLALTDEGTYTATGTATSGTWTQQSTLNSTQQATGTYAVDPATNRLTLDTTVQGVRNVIVLQKN